MKSKGRQQQTRIVHPSHRDMIIILM